MVAIVIKISCAQSKIDELNSFKRVRVAIGANADVVWFQVVIHIAYLVDLLK